MSASDNRELREAIQKIAGTYNKDTVSITACIVTSNADAETKFTIDCSPISGVADTSMPGVKLNTEANDGMLIIPVVGSTVMVINSTMNEYYVYMYSDILKVVFIIDNNNRYEFSSSGFIWNGGNNGGLINIVQQTAKLNALVSQIQAQLPLIAAGIATGGGSYTPGTLSSFNKSDYEDLYIKH